MSHLSVATTIEKNRVDSDTPFLVCMVIEVVDPATGAVAETLRLVRNSEDIVFQGETFAAIGFDMSFSSEAGAQPQVTVTIPDQQRAIEARLQAYRGGVGSRVKILVINAGNLDQPEEVSETYTVQSAGSKNYVVSFILGAENALMLPFPRRRQLRDQCAWKYKGAECGYSGFLPSCDRTLQGPNGCAVHNNVVRFGGYPGLNSNGARYI